MMALTDRHCRYFYRLLSKKALLYSEMISCDAMLRGDRNRLLDFDPKEHPIALQVAGNDAVAMAQCAVIAQDWGYDEININVGCPSERVQKGAFGACLMKMPQVVADCVAAMRARVSLPISVKCRLGVDDQDHYDDLRHFVQTVAQAGCQTFIVSCQKSVVKRFER